MAKLDERIGFLGGGNMAFAIGYGLINRGICTCFNLKIHRSVNQISSCSNVFRFFFWYFRNY